MIELRTTPLIELLNERECPWLDWKAAVPTGLAPGSPKPADRDNGKGRMLKTMSAIANSITDRLGYLVYGVADQGDRRAVVGLDHYFDDDADLREWVRNTFDPVVEFQYRVERNEGKTVALFEIWPSSEYPHVSRADVGNELRDGQVWVRQGSRNTVCHHRELKTLFRASDPIEVGDFQNGAVVNTVRAFYAEQGWELFASDVHAKDEYLEKGHRIAYYPHSRRHVLGNNGRHILMLRRP